MIKFLQSTEPIIYQCQTPFVHPDESGELKTYNVRVRYRSHTIRDIKQQRAELLARHAGDPDSIVYLSETLARRVIALPDLIAENGQPVEVTEEFLESLMVENLQAIERAINEDYAAKLK